MNLKKKHIVNGWDVFRESNPRDVLGPDSDKTKKWFITKDGDFCGAYSDKSLALKEIDRLAAIPKANLGMLLAAQSAHPKPSTGLDEIEKEQLRLDHQRREERRERRREAFRKAGTNIRAGSAKFGSAMKKFWEGGRKESGGLIEESLDDKALDVLMYMGQNDYQLPLQKELMEEISTGDFDPNSAEKKFHMLVEKSDKEYRKISGSTKLSAEQATLLSKFLVIEFISEAEAGELNDLLPEGADSSNIAGTTRIMLSGGSLKAIDETENFYRQRFVSPEDAETCRVPSWASTAADSVHKGTLVTMCKRDKKWFLQSVQVPKDGLTKAEARRIAISVNNLLSDNKMAEGGLLPVESYVTFIDSRGDVSSGTVINHVNDEYVINQGFTQVLVEPEDIIEETNRPIISRRLFMAGGEIKSSISILSDMSQGKAKSIVYAGNDIFRIHPSKHFNSEQLDLLISQLGENPDFELKANGDSDRRYIEVRRIKPSFTSKKYMTKYGNPFTRGDIAALKNASLVRFEYFGGQSPKALIGSVITVYDKMGTARTRIYPGSELARMNHSSINTLSVVIKRDRGADSSKALSSLVRQLEEGDRVGLRWISDSILEAVIMRKGHPVSSFLLDSKDSLTAPYSELLNPPEDWSLPLQYNYPPEVTQEYISQTGVLPKDLAGAMADHISGVYVDAGDFAYQRFRNSDLAPIGSYMVIPDIARATLLNIELDRILGLYDHESLITAANLDDVYKHLMWHTSDLESELTKLIDLESEGTSEFTSEQGPRKESIEADIQDNKEKMRGLLIEAISMLKDSWAPQVQNQLDDPFTYFTMDFDGRPEDWLTDTGLVDIDYDRLGEDNLSDYTVINGDDGMLYVFDNYGCGTKINPDPKSDSALISADGAKPMTISAILMKHSDPDQGIILEEDLMTLRGLKEGESTMIGVVEVKRVSPEEAANFSSGGKLSPEEKKMVRNATWTNSDQTVVFEIIDTRFPSDKREAAKKYYGTLFRKGGVVQSEVVDRVKMAKKSIRKDVKSGIVPRTIESFSDLHEYVDANKYGGFLEQDYEMTENFELENRVQEQVNDWIVKGGLKKKSVKKTSSKKKDDFTGDYFSAKEFIESNGLWDHYSKSYKKPFENNKSDDITIIKNVIKSAGGGYRTGFKNDGIRVSKVNRKK